MRGVTRCAPAVNDNRIGDDAAPIKSVMKSRRRIAFPKARDYADDEGELQQGFATGGMGFQDQVAEQQS